MSRESDLAKRTATGSLKLIGRGAAGLARRSAKAGYSAASTEKCPHCGTRSKKRETVCPSCGREKAAAG